MWLATDFAPYKLEASCDYYSGDRQGRRSGCGVGGGGGTRAGRAATKRALGELAPMLAVPPRSSLPCARQWDEQ